MLCYQKRTIMKKIIGLSLLAGGLAFAQSGLMGGTSGIHQHNAYTLGQWGIEAGTGGDISTDSWSIARGGIITKNGQTNYLSGKAASIAGNFHGAIGLSDFIDIGAAIPLYYDHTNVPGAGDLWKATRGDVDMWLKVNPVGNEKTLFAFAALVDLYLPTGDRATGVRPRHAWYLPDDEGGSTNPFTSDDLDIGLTLIATLNFSHMGTPVVWNTHVGIVYAPEGSSTLVYGTGVNVLPTDWMDVFAEFSGEMRVEGDAYDIDPLSDPMRITPGLRFHLPWNIDFAMGVDIAVRALKNMGYDWNDEMDGVEDYELHYTDKHGGKVSYGYVPTPLIAGTASLTWRFGGKMDRDEDHDGVKDDFDKCPHTTIGKVDSVGCPIDSDKDGVIDGIDRCPNTLAGAVVDTMGCPMDADNDGVPDGLDECNDTPAGEPVYANGCFADYDKDGVSDIQDKCPNTPAGLPVDYYGCPLDGDKDGVIDSLDKCDDTPIGLAVDSVGCPLDSDKDGVFDGIDRCPGTREGATVDEFGCDNDNDGDGVFNEQDACPNTKAGVTVDSVGCPLDGDKDGVPDGLDQCPETPEGLAVDNTGCPLDFDKDGIPDALDKCPNTAAGMTVDSTGCSSDEDKDGVPDVLDKCPNTPKDAPVDSVGCPLDTDIDGVPDYLDKCPNTLPGIKIDKRGCPVNKKEDLEQLKKGIAFQTGSAKLTKASYGTLDDIIKLMKKITVANLEVQGHTDDTGSESANQKLSQDRAQAVVDYFIQQGIAPERVRAMGYGSSKPIADNKTKAGRTKNRRVELVPYQL